jgi:hypothetical protein
MTSPGKCKTDYVMPELRTINSMPNIPSCSTIVVLPTPDVTPITNFCKTRNIETKLNHYQELEIKINWRYFRRNIHSIIR